MQRRSSERITQPSVEHLRVNKAAQDSRCKTGQTQHVSYSKGPSTQEIRNEAKFQSNKQISERQPTVQATF